MMVFLSFLIIWTTINTQRWLGPGLCNCSHALSPICPSATEQGAFNCSDAVLIAWRAQRLDQPFSVFDAERCAPQP